MSDLIDLLISQASQTMSLVATCAQNTAPLQERACSPGLVCSRAHILLSFHRES